MNFCTKCGNDVRGSKFCTKCGAPVNADNQPKRAGFFQKIKNAQEQRDQEIRQNMERQAATKEGDEWVKSFLSEQDVLMWERDYALSEEHRKDVMPFFEMMEEIEKRYSILTNIDGGFQSNAADVLLSLCYKNIEMKKHLDKKWEGYEHHYIYTYSYQRIAMIYEKRGRYDLAASACVDAINDGFIRDRTSGGMPGRLARMIKRGKLDITPEMEIALKQQLS